MKIRTLDQVNSHWIDGRHYSAGVGAISEVDDADKDAIAHMRHLVKVGLAEVVDDEPQAEPSVEPAEEPANLRIEAEALGVKVDRRWGADRLRAEVDAARKAKA